MHAIATQHLINPLKPFSIRLLVSLPFPQHITEFLKRAPSERSLLPQIRRQKAVRIAYSYKGSLQSVLKSFRRAGGGSVDVLDASELEETLDGRGGDETGTTGSRDELVVSQYLIESNKGPKDLLEQ